MAQFWTVIYLSLTFISWAALEQIVMVQKPDCSSCKWTWTRYEVTCRTCPIVGWDHPSVPGDINALSKYTVCNILIPDGSSYYKSPFEPNNWLLSDLIQVHHFQAPATQATEVNRVDVTVEYSITQCPPSALYCKEYFDAYVWESDSIVVRDKIPHPINSNGSYRRFASFNRQSSGFAVLTVPLVLSRLYFALGFRDQGGCKILNSVKVTYNVCSQTTLRRTLVSVPRTLTPSNDSESISVLGECSANSVPVSNSLNVLCESNGEWNITGLGVGCVCKEDMENIGGKCAACSQGTYNDANELNCTAIPSHPRNVVTLFVNQTSATINWQPPTITGDQVFYEVKCHRTCEIDGKDCTEEICGGDNNAGFVFMNKSYATTMTIPGTTGLLSPFVNYTCKIVAKNRVSEVAARKHKVEARSTTITFKTKGSVPGIPEVFVQQAEDGATVLSWKLKCKNGIIEKYMVTYFDMDDTSDDESLTTPETEQRIQKLSAGKTYEFQVTAVNNFGQGRPGTKRFTIPNNLSGLSFKTKMVIAGVVGGGGLLLVYILVIIIVILRFKRSIRNNMEGHIMSEEDTLPMEELNHLEVVDERNEHDAVNVPEWRTNTLSSVELNLVAVEEERNEDDGINVPEYLEIINSPSFELKREKIKIERLLGSGDFGEVYKASLDNDTVAVKSLKASGTAKDKQDMITELNVMKTLKPHPHVLKLIGCCSISDPLLIVVEYLPYGDLLGYLRKSRGHSDSYNTGEKKPASKLTAKDLLSFAWMIADGMHYLATMKIIHRDLAARNILVGENQVCKISDFGLARDVNDDIYVRTSQARLPVKWMPPESLFHGESSTMSDVWSYGIVLWEVFTIGDSPYPGFTARQTVSMLERGYRMQRPIHISEELFSIMSECWSEKPEERPTFKWICTAVNRLITDTKTCIDLDEYNDADYVNFDMAEGAQ